MAFSAILRRSAASLAPVGARLMHTQKKRAPALFTALYQQAATAATAAPVKPPMAPFSSFSQIHHYSSAVKAQNTSADEKLLCVLESEIDAVELEEDETDEIPADFPFEIEDNAGEQTITLTRKYKGENIKVRVHMPDYVGEGDSDEPQASIPLVVKISKRTGPSLEFGCTAFIEDFTIDSVSLKDPKTPEDEIAYEGPDFLDLDESLQKAFQTYLEERGITTDTTDFVHEYMIEKDSREYKTWLKNLKDFVEA